MTNNPIIDLVLQILLQIGIAGAVYYCYRHLDFSKPQNLIGFAIVNWTFILNTYGIGFYFAKFFPSDFPITIFFLSASILVLLCLLPGYYVYKYIKRD